MSVATYRKIPLSTKFSILFGGFANQFGWAFFGFGLIFFWAFAMDADLSFNHDVGEMIRVEGIATGFAETDASEGDVMIFENHYKFETEDGIEHEGVSYATGQRVLKGDTLIIEYPQDNPQYSRIKGMRRKTFSPFVLFVVIFPLVGLIFILLGTKRSVRALKLLKNGVLTKGVLISKNRTNTKINGRSVYKMNFRYQDNQGTEYILKVRTPMPIYLQDQKEERMLYLRRKPSYAIMLDALPSSVILNSDDLIESMPPLRVVFLMFFPLLTIVGHGIYLVNTYFG